MDELAEKGYYNGTVVWKTFRKKGPGQDSQAHSTIWPPDPEFS
jgi:hypothetical protein